MMEDQPLRHTVMPDSLHDVSLYIYFTVQLQLAQFYISFLSVDLMLVYIY